MSERTTHTIPLRAGPFAVGIVLWVEQDGDAGELFVGLRDDGELLAVGDERGDWPVAARGHAPGGEGVWSVDYPDGASFATMRATIARHGRQHVCWFDTSREAVVPTASIPAP